MSGAAFRAPVGCPCTPALLCSSDQRGLFNTHCDIPQHPALSCVALLYTSVFFVLQHLMGPPPPTKHTPIIKGIAEKMVK
jgi:hypothetical protein